MVHEPFVMAKEHAPSIIFVDEINSIGSSSGDSGVAVVIQKCRDHVGIAEPIGWVRIYKECQSDYDKSRQIGGSSPGCGIRIYR